MGICSCNTICQRKERKIPPLSWWWCMVPLECLHSSSLSWWWSHQNYHLSVTVWWNLWQWSQIVHLGLVRGGGGQVVWMLSLCFISSQCTQVHILWPGHTSCSASRSRLISWHRTSPPQSAQGCCVPIETDVCGGACIWEWSGVSQWIVACVWAWYLICVQHFMI